MKANSDKSHLLMSCDGTTNLLSDGFSIESSIKEALFGITIDKKLKFDEHVNNFCKNACQKLNALARIATFMNIEKKILIMKAFIESQFGYCPLIWMLCSHNSMNKINKIQARTPHLLYNSYNTTFDELLLISGQVSMHMRCI